MKIPATYVAFRAATAAICVLALLLFGLGVAGNGPLGQLSGVASEASSWLHIHWNPGGQQQ